MYIYKPIICGRHIYASYNFHLVMSLGATFFQDWFCASRNGGTGGDGWVQLKGADSMAASGLSYRKPWVGHWAGHFSPPLHKWA